MPVSYNDFCFILSLQAGVVATSIIGFTLMIITFVFNLYAPNPMDNYHKTCQYILLYIYLLIMMHAFGLGFMSAFWQTTKKLRTASIFLLVGGGLYLLLSIFSFISTDSIMLYICPGMRCPDHHFLQDARWRGVYDNMDMSRLRGLLSDNRKNFSIDLVGTAAYDPPVTLKKPATPDRPTPFYTATTEESSPPATGLSKTHVNRDVVFLDEIDYDHGVIERCSITLTYEDKSTTSPRPDQERKKEDNMALLLLSFVYTLAFIVFLVYTFVTYYAFGKQIDKYEDQEAG